jgi:hypothetical protein
MYSFQAKRCPIAPFSRLRLVRNFLGGDKKKRSEKKDEVRIKFLFAFYQKKPLILFSEDKPYDNFHLLYLEYIIFVLKHQK